MKLFAEIFQYFPLVLSGIVAVEQTIGSESGATKKTIVLNSIQAAAKVAENAPAVPVAQISTLIDDVVATLNNSGVFNHGIPPAPVAPAQAP